MLPLLSVALEDLSAQSRNPRIHSARQIQQIAKSIKEFGFVNPILIDKDRKIGEKVAVSDRSR